MTNTTYRQSDYTKYDRHIAGIGLHYIPVTTQKQNRQCTDQDMQSTEQNNMNNIISVLFIFL